ncbi:hypothetical protein KIN20_002569 [Parelaphostrongylus tenuis]|uniref:Uncharacterized protein n=1 Tax=Parelaphostrongylus tenuis TaxID=148309 RepID=A0AAD5QGU3_PARTN|nr:hypothetical protein KIN20_002569 [Parelaphostrongylus tenuis]
MLKELLAQQLTIASDYEKEPFKSDQPMQLVEQETLPLFIIENIAPLLLTNTGRSCLRRFVVRSSMS